MKTIISTIIILMLTVTIFAQSDKPVLDSWRGLVIDASTPDEAIKILGAPEKDKPNEKFTPLVYSKWFGNKIETRFRKLSFKNVEGFDKVDLFFNNDKLAVIQFDMKKELSAAALVTAYQSKFYPLVGNFGGGVTPDELSEGNREVIYPDKFPLAYQLAAANDKAIGVAFASSGFAENLASAMVTPRGQQPKALSGALPGIVRTLQLISRTLENKKGTDLLK